MCQKEICRIYVLPSSRNRSQIRGDIVDCVPIPVAVILCSLRIQMDGLHGAHEGVSHPHSVLHNHIQVLGRHHPISDQPPTLIEYRVLHPVEDKPRHLPGQGDWSLANLLHQSPGPVPHLLACPGGGHQLHHGRVVRRVAGVGHNKLGFVFHKVGNLARN